MRMADFLTCTAVRVLQYVIGLLHFCIFGGDGIELGRSSARGSNRAVITSLRSMAAPFSSWIIFFLVLNDVRAMPQAMEKTQSSDSSGENARARVVRRAAYNYQTPSDALQVVVGRWLDAALPNMPNRVHNLLAANRSGKSLSPGREQNGPMEEVEDGGGPGCTCVGVWAGVRGVDRMAQQGNNCRSAKSEYAQSCTLRLDC